MKSIFVLIIFVFGNSGSAGMSIHSQEFTSIERCKIAQETLLSIETLKKVNAFCVEK